MNWKLVFWLFGAAVLFMSPIWVQWIVPTSSDEQQSESTGREEVVFWHFWGGQDRDIVEDVARRFNESQSKYFVRPIAMPGNNLQAKIFLSVAGGDPPDLVNQDDPILADWAELGLIHPLSDFVSSSETEELKQWLFPAAERLSTYDGSLYGVCNGLDVRALYYNQTALNRKGLPVPRTLEEFNETVQAITPASREPSKHYAYLPDSRRLWAWGFVFGGRFFNEQTEKLSLTSPPLVAALTWMKSFAEFYGADNVAAFRKGDQSLPGKTFPLLPIQDTEMLGRYLFVMDGQWRVRDINDFQQRRKLNGIPSPQFGVIPLPPPTSGRRNAGWVNGNFFVVPRGAKNPEGSWAFIKFWIGMGNIDEAVNTNIQGGWIPVSEKVVAHSDYQAYLEQQPLFRTFIDLASSPDQYPIPQVPGAPFFRRRIESVGFEALNNPALESQQILEQAEIEIEQALQRKKALIKDSATRNRR